MLAHAVGIREHRDTETNSAEAGLQLTRSDRSDLEFSIIRHNLSRDCRIFFVKTLTHIYAQLHIGITIKSVIIAYIWIKVMYSYCFWKHLSSRPDLHELFRR